MTTITPTDSVVTTAQSAATTHEGSYVDWPAIFGGIVLASAISLLLLTFGSALGLSFADFQAGGPDARGIAIGAGIFLFAVQLLSFMSGAYVTGRMRRRMHDATEHESDFRDGVHGLLVWAGALLVGAMLAVNGIGMAASTVGNTVGSTLSTVTNAASNVAGGAAENLGGAGGNPTDYFADQLFRPAQGAAPAAPGTPGTDPRAEAGRILAQSAVSGEMSQPDRDYLATVIAQNTGMTPEQAQARVNEVNTTIDNTRQQAVDAADAARRTAVLGAFAIAAALLISAVGAFWAAHKGGDHRDDHSLATRAARVFRRF